MSGKAINTYMRASEITEAKYAFDDVRYDMYTNGRRPKDKRLLGLTRADAAQFLDARVTNSRNKGLLVDVKDDGQSVTIQYKHRKTPITFEARPIK